MGTGSIAQKTDSGKPDKPRGYVDPEGYGVTEEIEKKIRNQAWKIGSEHGDYAEIDDLAQEGRIAAWKKATACEPRVDYCLNESRRSMGAYARSGYSVDGRIWPRHRRPKVYDIKSLDAPLQGHGMSGDTTLGGALPDPYSDTESQVLSHIMLDDIKNLLTDDELEIARAKAAGFTLTELKKYSVYTRFEIEEYSRNIRQKIASYLGRDDLMPKPRGRKTGARFKT